MFVPLPNLDDRRWTDLTDEARALIPVLSPGWTDFNESDPGITLVELLAWITESDIYRVNRIPDTHRLAFLSLIGVNLQPTAPAFAAVQFRLKDAPSLTLPATTQLAASMLDGKPGKFQLQEPVTVLPVGLMTVQVLSGSRLRDVTGAWKHRDPVAVFGSDPQPGDALYLTFTGSVQPGKRLSIYFNFGGSKASRAERQRILDELRSRAEACPPSRSCVPSLLPAEPPTLPPHHSAVIAWELQTGPGTWHAMNAVDNTRSLTLDGCVSLAFSDATTLHAPIVLRCRFTSGAFDAAPIALAILENTVGAEQCTPAWETWPILAGVTAGGTPPVAGTRALLNLAFNAAGSISALTFGQATENGIPGQATENGIPVTVLSYTPANTSSPGSLTVEAARVAMGTGAPNQLYTLAGCEQLCGLALLVYTVENGTVRSWAATVSFADSGPGDAHFVPDPAAAQLLFGDGEHGRVPPAGSTIIAVISSSAGAAGNVSAGAIAALDPGPHNAATLDLSYSNAQLASVRNPDPALDGEDPETIEHAEGRAALLVTTPERAVTLSDCRVLALQVPGTSLARAAAIAGHLPGLDCYAAPGVLTVVIVPSLPRGRPVPSPGLLLAVNAYLSRRSVLGTRIAVTGPDFLEVTVEASVTAYQGQDKAAVRDRVIAALKRFLDPLGGGPDDVGWPLGRAVYVSEILDVIAQVAGVDHVSSLALSAQGCGATCGDIHLNPLALVVSGAHTVRVN